MNDRVPCIVPFCRRTRAPFPDPALDEWICPKHWLPLRPAMKARYRLLKATLRKAERRGRRLPATEWATHRQWHRLKQAAIEIAAGISG